MEILILQGVVNFCFHKSTALIVIDLYINNVLIINTMADITHCRSNGSILKKKVFSILGLMLPWTSSQKLKD